MVLFFHGKTYFFYFQEELKNYKYIARNKPSKQDPTKNPSLRLKQKPLRAQSNNKKPLHTNL